MKTLVTYLLPVIFSLLVSTLAIGQSSKSCGSCQKPVSSNSQVGDYCPHCNVRWGYENTTSTTTSNYNYDNSDYNANYSSYEEFDFALSAYVNSSANLRAYASKSAFIWVVVPKYESIKVIGKSGDWYHVNYYEGGALVPRTGYIHKTLIKF